MDSSSVSRPSKYGKGLLIVLGLFAGCGITVIGFWWLRNQPLAPGSPAVLNIGDGSGLMGQEILAAAAVLSNERGVRIEFFGQRKGSILTTGPSSPFCIEVDAMSIRINPWNYLINDEEVSLSVLRERVHNYGTSARLTDSRPILVVSCSEGVEGTTLIDLFQFLVDNGIDLIRLPDYRWLFEPRPSPPPPPPAIKPLAHPIELK